MWPAIMAAIIGSVATTAGQRMLQKSPPKPSANPMMSFQEAKERNPLGDDLLVDDILGRYLNSGGKGI